MPTLMYIMRIQRTVLARIRNMTLVSERDKVMRGKKITKTQQRVASSILTEFMFAKDMEEVQMIWDDLFERYELLTDPFTYTPCTPEEYAKSRLNYVRQVMEELYGHCDGLD